MILLMVVFCEIYLLHLLELLSSFTFFFPSLIDFLLFASMLRSLLSASARTARTTLATRTVGSCAFSVVTARRGGDRK
jgi:hypothetical protein